MMLLGMQITASPVVLAAEWEAIRNRGHLIIAVKDNRRPLGFVDDTGTLVGYEIDIARHLAQELLGSETAVRFQPVSNEDRLGVVESGQVDMAIAGLAITPMRQRVVSFSTPYYLDGTGFVTRQPTVRSLRDLRQGAIALLQGSDAGAAIAFLFPHARLMGVSSYQSAWRTLEAGTADAFAGDVTVLAGWVQLHPDYTLLPERVTTVPLAIALPKGVQYDPLRRRVNAALGEWQETGWLAERAAAWDLP